MPPNIIYTLQPSDLGDVMLAATHNNLIGCWFHDQAHLPEWQTWRRDDEHPLLHQAHQQWTQFLSGKARGFQLPLHFAWGTPFQQSVWTALQTIPYGTTTTYRALAQSIGRPLAVRAVGAAVGKNPLSLVIPCHRVLGANGSLTGYAGGLHRKQRLLQLESQHT